MPPLVLALAAVLAASPQSSGGTPPPGFSFQPIVESIPRPTDFAVDGAGRIWITEQPGRVRLVSPDECEQGGAIGSIVLDIREEVLTFHDLGLVGLALHPGFEPDGGPTSWIYLLYTVDRDPPKDAAVGDEETATLGRLARWRAVTIEETIEVDPTSRQVLLGECAESGAGKTAIAVLFHSHQGGGLVFGRDGSLFVSTGDGARFDGPDLGGTQPWGFDDFVHPVSGLVGPIAKSQDIGAFRAQSLVSLSGKVLRIDPETGLGLATNPFHDGDPDAIESRIWALGFRNPFRLALVPDTGDEDPEVGDPGVLIAAEIGDIDWEELHLVERGTNAGWPCYEGIAPREPFASWKPDPASPLAYPDCAEPLTPPSMPIVAWRRDSLAALYPPGIHVDLTGAPADGFSGMCAIGGAFYLGDSYPAAYRGRYFFADYGFMWVKALALDDRAQAVDVIDIPPGVTGPVAIRTLGPDGDVLVLSRAYGSEIGTILRLVHVEEALWSRVETFGLPGDVLDLACDSHPAPGEVLEFHATGAEHGAIGFFAIATAPAHLPVGTFSVLISPVAPILVVVQYDAEGELHVNLPLPAAAHLVGLPLGFQTFALGTEVFGGIAASNALFTSIQAP